MSDPPETEYSLDEYASLCESMRRLSANQEPELLELAELEAVLTAVAKDGKRVGGGYSLNGSAPAKLSNPADWGLIPYITVDGLRRAKKLRRELSPGHQAKGGRPPEHDWDLFDRLALYLAIEGTANLAKRTCELYGELKGSAPTDRSGGVKNRVARIARAIKEKNPQVLAEPVK